METRHEPSDTSQSASTVAGNAGKRVELPPVWIRLPDLSAATETLVAVPTSDADAGDRDGRTRPGVGAGPIRRWASLLAFGAMAVVGVTLYWFLPGSDRPVPDLPPNEPPPSWEASSSDSRWRGQAAESDPSGTTAAPRQARKDRTANAPTPDGQRPIPSREPDSTRYRYRAAEFEGTIENDSQRRARHEHNRSRLY